MSRTARFLCPKCGELRLLTEVIGNAIKLACDHTRPLSLPVKPGNVSIEQLGTEDGQRLFPPAIADDEKTRPQWQDWGPEKKWR